MPAAGAASSGFTTREDAVERGPTTFGTVRARGILRSPLHQRRRAASRARRAVVAASGETLHHRTARSRLTTAAAGNHESRVQIQVHCQTATPASSDRVGPGSDEQGPAVTCSSPAHTEVPCRAPRRGDRVSVLSIHTSSGVTMESAITTTHCPPVSEVVSSSRSNIFSSTAADAEPASDSSRRRCSAGTVTSVPERRVHRASAQVQPVGVCVS
jgi:hypothetical protein